MSLIEKWRKELSLETLNLFLSGIYYLDNLSPEVTLTDIPRLMLHANSEEIYAEFDDKLLLWMSNTWGKRISFDFSTKMVDRYTLEAWVNVGTLLHILKGHLPKSTQFYIEKVKDTTYFQELTDRFNNISWLIYSAAITLHDLDPGNKSIFDGEKLLISTHTERDNEIIKIIKRTIDLV